MARKQYGQLNYAEGGMPDLFTQLESALRAAAYRFNVGKVYNRTTVQVGGVKAGDIGIMPTWPVWHWAGTLGATLRPIGITPGQTYLAQWAATPTRWDGDAPATLQPSPARLAPWRRSVVGGNPKTVFTSGMQTVPPPLWT